MKATAKELAKGTKGPLGWPLIDATLMLPTLVLEGKQSKFFSGYSIVTCSNVSQAVF